MSLSNCINLYLKNSKYTKREGTYDYEYKHLKLIQRYLEGRKIYNTTNVTLTVIYDFIKLQQSKGISNNTINKRIGLLKQCFKFAVKQRFITSNPLSGMKSLRIRKRETITIPRYIIIEILDHLKRQKRTNVNLRNEVIVHLLLDTGLRLNELVNLNIENVNLSSNTINLTYTKTSVDRTVFITEKTKKLLEAYIPHLKKRYGPLIVEFRNNKKVIPRYINKILSDIANRLQIKQSISPHKWRHTYATMCLQNGANLEFVRKTLGHSNLQTTQKYLHLERKELSKQHEAYSPLTKM